MKKIIVLLTLICALGVTAGCDKKPISAEQEMQTHVDESAETMETGTRGEISVLSQQIPDGLTEHGKMQVLSE